MFRYAARAVPWPRVLFAAGLILVLMDVVRRWPWVMWPMQGTAVGLLAAAAAWCADEPAAAVVDSAPRGLAWRTGARGWGVAVLLTSWAVAVWRCRASTFGHPWPVALQGVAAVAVAVAWTLWRRSAGESTPGHRLALVVVPLTTAWALVRPLARQLPVFPYADGGRYGDWAASQTGWGAVGLAAAVAAAVILADVRWWPLKERP